MKKPVVLLLLLMAGDVVAQESQRYLVATRRPVNALAPALRDVDFTPRDVVAFANVDGFAASLTSDEYVALRTSRDVRYIERVVERHLLGERSPMPATEQERNLTGQTLPWGIDAVRAREVWPYTRGAVINVAVLDTGIDARHPDLNARYQGGFNAVGTGEPFDDHGHGTHVAGTIAATDDNVGVVGVAPQAKLWGVKVLAASGAGTSETLIRGIDWVVTQKQSRGGNWVVNLSLGSAQSSLLEREAFRRAVDAGLLIFAATGNESSGTVIAPVGYPAAYPGVLAIGAVTPTLAAASFSNQGPEVALAAPGVDVLSSVPVGTNVAGSVLRGSQRFAGIGLEGTKTGMVSGPFVYCGLGYPQSFPSTVNGRIALIKRGEIPFADKVRNAQAAGATAVVIFNHDTSAMSWTLYNQVSDRTVSWPVTVGINLAGGDELLKQTTAMITAQVVSEDYASYQGTSMATPHAAGVGALVWSLAPGASASNVAAALTQSAQDLGARGTDTVFGAGLVNAINAAKTLSPATFGLPTAPAPPVVTRRRATGTGK